MIDEVEEEEEHRVYVNLGSISHGSHLFDIQDNMSLKDFLEGLLEYIDGVLWQHAAIATDIEVLAVIPLDVDTTDLAARLRLALAKYMNCTRLGDNDLVWFRFAVREAIDLDSATFTHECERIMHLRTDYARICMMPVRGFDTMHLPVAGRSRRKRRF